MYDNLTTAIKKVLTGKERIEQTAFVSFRSYYCLQALFCNRSRGNEKDGTAYYTSCVMRGEKFLSSCFYLLVKTTFPILFNLQKIDSLKSRSLLFTFVCGKYIFRVMDNQGVHINSVHCHRKYELSNNRSYAKLVQYS